MLNYETKIETTKETLERFSSKKKRFKAKTVQRDGKEERILYRNCEFNNKIE